MKKTSVASILFLAISSILTAQSEEITFAETENAAMPVAGAAPVINNFRQEGIASWYGTEFAGRATASGEIFDPAKLTAAHADLPFGTYLTVTNTENGKKIAVRVNDRGPFVRSRILDVSRAAAERLDMLSAGTAKVIIEATTYEAAQALVREIATATPAAQTRAATPPATTPAAATTPPTQAGTAAPSATAPATATTPPAATTIPPTQARTTTPPVATPAAAPSTATPASASTPVMTQTAPKTPAQMASSAKTAPIVPASAPLVPVPSSSSSRLTGQAGSIPEIRRPPETGYVVIEDQIPATPLPAYTPAPAYSPAAAAPTTPAYSAATPARPAVTPSSAAPVPAAATREPPATQTNPAATPVSPVVSPSSAAREPSATQTNPAASVPVTNPPAVTEIKGSPMVEGRNYRIQVGSFTNLVNASGLFLKLTDAGLNPSYERFGDKYYRVVLTNVKAEEAETLSRKLASVGIVDALAREEASR
jgi:rare lipoprotein A